MPISRPRTLGREVQRPPAKKRHVAPVVTARKRRALLAVAANLQMAQPVAVPPVAYRWDEEDGDQGPVVELQDSEDDGGAPPNAQPPPPLVSSAPKPPPPPSATPARAASKPKAPASASTETRRPKRLSNKRRSVRERRRIKVTPDPTKFPKMEAGFIAFDLSDDESESSEGSQPPADDLDEEGGALAPPPLPAGRGAAPPTGPVARAAEQPAGPVAEEPEPEVGSVEEEEEEEEAEEAEEADSSAGLGTHTTLDLLTVARPKAGDGCIVYMCEAARLVFFGRLRLRVLFGAVDVFGKRLGSGSAVSLDCPAWSGALPIAALPVREQDAAERTFNDDAPGVGVDTRQAVANLCAVLLLRDWPPSPLAAHLAFSSDEQMSAFARYLQRHQQLTQKQFLLATAAVVVRLLPNFPLHVVEFTPDALQQLPRRLLELPRRPGSAALGPTAYPRRVPVIVVVGAVGTGKSTLCRYLVNRLLNAYPSVRLLDADLGQSEFGPPGLVSLTAVAGLVAGPPHCHPLPATAAHYIGDVSMADCEEVYVDAVRDLLQRYRQEVQAGSAASPLVVNTHGWVEAAGWSATLAIIRMAQPDHLFVLQPSDLMVSASSLSLDLRSQDDPVLYNVAGAVVEVEVTTLQLVPKAKDKGTVRAAHRTLALAAYFGAQYAAFAKWAGGVNPRLPGCAYCGPVCFADFLLRFPPYKVALEDLFVTSLCAPSVLKDFPDAVLDLLNGALVGLLAIGQEPEQALPGPRGLRLLQRPLAAGAVTVGLGVVRQLLPDKGALHVITPVPPDELQRVNCLALGPAPLPLHWRTPAAPTGRPAPYVTYDTAEGLGCGRMMRRL